jgi:two-component system CheB/CheR fusion protein
MKIVEPLSAPWVDGAQALLTPGAIEARAARIQSGPEPLSTVGSSTVPNLDDEDALRRILALLRAAREVDFTLYRQTTLRRRIARRMVLGKVPSLHAYLDVLRERPLEVEALYQDILIKVTHFFRDPEVFEALSRAVFPALVKGHRGDAPLRIWVPGCSTGEEAYSLAIALTEVIGALHARVPFQIFATDVSDVALETARRGAYPESIATDVSPERLRRFFTRAGERYQIVRPIREGCVFARQNVTRDPPFSRLDLVSCRNLLIYLDPALQRRVLPVFHDALRPSGFLVLGASETVGGLTELFSIVEKKSKIYTKSASTSHLGHDPKAPEARTEEAVDHARPEPRPRADASLPESLRTRAKAEGGAEPAFAQTEADRLMMERYAPPAVLVNAELSIVQFRGHTGPFLEPAPGEASLDVLKMARKGLALELRAAIHKARSTGAPVRVDGIHLEDGAAPRNKATGAARAPRKRPLPPLPTVSVEVVPLAHRAGGHAGSPQDRWLLVLFQENDAHPPVASPARAGKARPGHADDDARVAKIERELHATKEYLQATLEEQEATHEELQCANEELISSNEELQSINEELETAKEEQDATNEELNTLNVEYKSRNAELHRLAGDLSNLLASLDLPVVMLDRDLTIRRFTPAAERVLHLIPSDIGRPIGDLNPRIEAPDLEPLVSAVIDTGVVHEREVRDREGRWYSMRLRPYRTADERIDGAVMVLVDIDRVRRGPPREGGSAPGDAPAG